MHNSHFHMDSHCVRPLGGVYKCICLPDFRGERDPEIFLQKKRRALIFFFSIFPWCLTAAIYLQRRVNDQQRKHGDCTGSALLLLAMIKTSLTISSPQCNVGH